MASYFVETTADRWDALCEVEKEEYPTANKEYPTEEGTRESM
jgi:hypothetical protein